MSHSLFLLSPSAEVLHFPLGSNPKSWISHSWSRICPGYQVNLSSAFILEAPFLREPKRQAHAEKVLEDSPNSWKHCSHQDASGVVESVAGPDSVRFRMNGPQSARPEVVSCHCSLLNHHMLGGQNLS